MISVRAELDAIAEPQPKVWKPASRMVSDSGSTLRLSRRASPQDREPTSPMPFAPSTAPAFRGEKK